jgi:hypothetical protein
MEVVPMIEDDQPTRIRITAADGTEIEGMRTPKDIPEALKRLGEALQIFGEAYADAVRLVNESQIFQQIAALADQRRSVISQLMLDRSSMEDALRNWSINTVAATAPQTLDLDKLKSVLDEFKGRPVQPQRYAVSPDFYEWLMEHQVDPEHAMGFICGVPIDVKVEWSGMRAEPEYS